MTYAVGDAGHVAHHNDVEGRVTAQAALISTLQGQIAPPFTWVSTGAAVVPVTVKGAASQSANLQEWQNSGGSVLASVSSGGRVRGLQGGEFYGPSATGYALYAEASSASVKPLIAKGAASQTANLQEWQNSAGTAITIVNSAGNIVTTTAIYGRSLVHTAGGTSPVLTLGTTDITITAGAATVKPLVLKGAASQSANLQEWQDSGGSALARVTPTGAIAVSGVQETSAGLTVVMPSTGRNLGLVTGAPSYGGGTAVVFVGNATAVPTTNPTGGGILYAEAGALKWRGSSGTITVLAPA